jgi:hypothetical protein
MFVLTEKHIFQKPNRRFRMTIPYNITAKNVSLVLDGKPHIVPRNNGTFDKIVEAIKIADLEALRNLIAPKQNIATFSEGRIAYNGRDLTFNGDPIHNAIKERLHWLWSNGLDLAPLLRFLDNLMDNPSFRAVNETYGFLDACDLPITDDGCFLAYKMIRSDYSDIYTGTMDNSVGQTLRVPRNMVDEDSNQTCSYGLHVCSQGYLGCYGRAGGNDRIVIVKVNPADVVAVPSDYNNAKMRVCAYEVVGELSWDDVNLDKWHTTSFSGNDDADLDDTSYEDDDWWDDDTQDDGWGDHVNDLDTEPDFDSYYEDSSEDDDEVPVPVISQSGKLSVSQVQDIKRLLAEPINTRMSIVNIARLYGVNESTVRKIRDEKIHKDVDF